MKIRLSIPVLTMLILAGCSSHPYPTAVQLPSDLAAPIVVEVPQSAGSLWTESRGSLFSDIKARHVGDILTVAIYEQASASREATTSTGRSSNASAGIDSFFGLESNLAKLNSSIDPSKLVSTDYTNSFKGSGSTSRKEDLVATLTTRVIEVFPNGNLRIEGGKTVTVNNEDQIIVLSGIVRPNDISPQNLVNSKYILDSRITYTGKGVISDKQKPGWMVRILDNVWPF
jgi:flagellar L-ring protein precursor FlgH